MIIRSSDSLSSTPYKDPLDQHEREKTNVSRIIDAIEDLRQEKPDVYARLQTDKRFRRLPLAQEPERSELLRWF